MSPHDDNAGQQEPPAPTREGDRVTPLSKRPAYYAPDDKRRRAPRQERTFATLERLAWGLVVVLFVAAVGLGLRLSPWGAFAYRAWLVPLFGGPLAHIGEMTLERHDAQTRPLLLAQATDQARRRLHDALRPDPRSLEGVAAHAAALRGRQDYERAATLVDAAEDSLGPSPPLAAERIRLLLADGRPRLARREAWAAIDQLGPGDALMDALDATLTADERFHPERPLTLRAGKDLTGLTPMRLSGLQLEAPRPHLDTPGRFAPQVPDPPLNHLSPIAAWRLCELLRCAVEVPNAQPARISVSSLELLTPRAVRRKGWTSRLQVREDRDGQWIYGAWLTPDLHGRRFPIEHDDRWGTWLDPEADLDNTEGSAALALEPLRGEEDPVVRVSGLQRTLGERPTSWLAGQVSDLVTLSYLAGAPVPPDHRAGRVRLSKDGLHVHDFAGAFTAEQDAPPDDAIARVRRFRPQTLTALKLLDRKRADRWLFPDAAVDPHQKKAADAFWARRDKLLAHIEDLEDKHGEHIRLDEDEP